MQTPYSAVIFTSTRTELDDKYSEMALKMETFAKQQSGFLGKESARNEILLTVSYWESLEAIANWKQNLDHLNTQFLGRQKWYENYVVRIAKVEKEYGFEK